MPGLRRARVTTESEASSVNHIVTHSNDKYMEGMRHGDEEGRWRSS